VCSQSERSLRLLLVAKVLPAWHQRDEIGGRPRSRRRTRLFFEDEHDDDDEDDYHWSL